MDTKKLFAELEHNFGLRKNHILILDALSKDEYTADKLVHDTGISMGKIYNFLNDLLEMKLIEKKPGYPAIYTVGLLEDRIIDFAKFQDESSAKKEKMLLGLLKEEGELDQIEYMADEDQSLAEDMKLINGSQKILTIEKYGLLPQILYPLEEEEFFDVLKYICIKNNIRVSTRTSPIRKMAFRAVKETYNKGKTFHYIIDRESVEDIFGLFREHYNKKYNLFLDKIISQLESHPKIKVSVINISSPLHVRIGGDRVLIGLAYFGSTAGVLVKSKKFASFYTQYFEEIAEKAVPIKQILSKYRRGKTWK